ncbi:MAG TPA: LD-carboxypeptidase [Vicinamibacteria bacterium]|nr:LD-carboxypeptidase [Vicinamibacteria bacterium]
MERRGFLKLAGTAALAPGAAGPALGAPSGASSLPKVVKPPRLRAGDVAGLVAPASANFESVDIEIAQEVARAFGLEPRLGAHVRDRHGYLAGRDEDRAADVNRFFADPSVKAVLAIQGGWGCARVLPHLDWDVIRANPKVVAGFSDITGLHCGLQAKTGLVTFHAPNALSAWPAFSVDHFRRVVFEGEALTMANPPATEDRLVQRENRTRAIMPGRARGRLVGGNLTVLTALVGTPYLPSFDGAILFLEDVREDIYRVDRMMTQLRLAGLLGRLRGFVFGSCSKCGTGESYGSLTLEEVLDEHVKPLGVPAYEGAMIGHQERQFTVPIGIEVEMDAAAGTIAMLEPAVA